MTKKEFVRQPGEKTVTYNGNLMRSVSDFSAETPQARKEWNELFKILNEKNHQPGISSKVIF